MLIWHKKLWLIDHGASLYFHRGPIGKARTKSFCTDKRSCIIASSFFLPETDVLFKILTQEVLQNIVNLIPSGSIGKIPMKLEAIQEVYFQFYHTFIPKFFINEAQNAREALI
jgi:hypothetical protein